MPGFIKPQLATLKAKAPSGEQWIHEIKYDGYRVQVRVNKGKKQVFTRNGLDWTKHPANPVFKPEPLHDWESNFTTSQTLMQLPDGSFRLWYAGRRQPPWSNLYFAIGTAHWKGPGKR